MIHFKVVKGSHIALAVSFIVLAAVLIFLLLQAGTFSPGSVENIPEPDVISVSALKAEASFASASSHQPLTIEIIPDETPATKRDLGRILIYHTHTHEAYAQDSSRPYEAVEAWRTLDNEHSVVRVGKALAAELRSLGFDVVHDTTDHEQDNLSWAYLRSMETLKGYDAETFDLYIDLHRDAYAEGLSTCYKDAAGAEYAQIMLLVGRGDDFEETEKPNYERNLALAQYITGELNRENEGIARNVTVKKGRYNQHACKNCILLEAGHNLNTLEQALASMPATAKAIYNASRVFF